MNIRKGAHAIGIFDSGLGGLTVARAIRDAFPDETIVYLGDTARVPYGTKSAQTVRQYAVEDMAFLLKQGVKVIIAACNTVSAAALPELEGRYDIPVVGVVEKGVEAALDSFSSGKPPRIGVIGTETTIGSEAYVRAIHKRIPDVEVIQKACPLFVPLIEEGWLDHRVTRDVIREYLAPMREAGVDTLILGCTHYPLIGPALGEFFGPEVRIVDSARAMVKALKRAFKEGVLERNGKEDAAISRYYATDRYHRFRELVRAFMGGDDIHVELVRPEDLSAAAEG